MNLEDKELSIQFYHYVCGIVGSEEVVKTRRQIFIALDDVSRNDDVTYISSGSKAEGLNLSGSDYDQMCVLNDVGVYESIPDVCSSHELTLIMDTTDTKPGFTKLRVDKSSNTYLSLINKWSKTDEPPIFISSKLFLESFLHLVHANQTNDLGKIHGPCVSTNDDSFDGVNWFRCKEWIKPAKNWIYRSGCIWPDNVLTQSIVKYGVLFVPIGCKNSVNEDLEWRISFSVAESLLIYSFSHTQILCYALLKIVLKDIIKHKHNYLICSYFLKTIMFWLCEESAAHQWTPIMFVRCFMSCLKRLIYCVEYETCLHYFIPDNNLFEGRFLYEQHKALLDTLYNIFHSPWNYVFHSATFENYRKAQRNSLTNNLTASSLSCLIHPTLVLLSFLRSISLKQVLIRTVNLQDKHISIHLLSIAALRFMLDFPFLKERNKSFYRQYQIMLQYFKTCVYSSSINAWALLASLFYKCGWYRECIDILNYCLSKCTLDKILISVNNDIEEQNILKILKQTFGLPLTCKYFIIDDVKMIKPFRLLPTELTPLIKELLDPCMMIPPVVYLNVLHFFCLHHLGNHSGKLFALRNLELTLREKYLFRETMYHSKMANKCLNIAKSML